MGGRNHGGPQLTAALSNFRWKKKKKKNQRRSRQKLRQGKSLSRTPFQKARFTWHFLLFVLALNSLMPAHCHLRPSPSSLLCLLLLLLLLLHDISFLRIVSLIPTCHHFIHFSFVAIFVLSSTPLIIIINYGILDIYIYIVIHFSELSFSCNLIPFVGILEILRFNFPTIYSRNHTHKKKIHKDDKIN